MLVRGEENVVVTSVVGMIAAVGLASWAMPRLRFRADAGHAGHLSGPSTWLLETAIGDRLAFMSLVPQPVATRWLVLAPLIALGLLGSVAMVLAGRGPAIAVVPAFGSAC